MLAGGKGRTRQHCNLLERKNSNKKQKLKKKKSAASKARHIQLVTRVLPGPGLEAGIESVEERITHATI